MGKLRPSRPPDDAQVPFDQQVRQTLEGTGIDPNIWLDTENAHFAGRTPRQLLKDGDEETVRDLLWAIRHGEGG